MRNIQLLNIKNEVLYESSHLSVREAVEVASQSGLCLDFINLDFHDLSGINLDGVSLHGASFFETNLCGATDIAETNLSGCIFSDWSSFTLAFGTAHRLHNCTFEVNKTICPISKPPLVIYGQNLSLSVLDDHILRKAYKERDAFTGMRGSSPIDQNGPIHVFPLDVNQLMIEFIRGEISGC